MKPSLQMYEPRPSAAWLVLFITNKTNNLYNKGISNTVKKVCIITSNGDKQLKKFITIEQEAVTKVKNSLIKKILKNFV